MLLTNLNIENITGYSVQSLSK